MLENDDLPSTEWNDSRARRGWTCVEESLIRNSIVFQLWIILGCEVGCMVASFICKMNGRKEAGGEENISKILVS